MERLAFSLVAGTGPICRKIDVCRLCGSRELAPVIDLGPQNIASIFTDSDVPETLAERYPLEVVRCSAPGGCGLVQLRHSVDPRVLYDNYGYRSGTNELMRANLREIALAVQEFAALRPGDTVLDIGCNDGTLLCSYNVPGLDRLGIDPAANVVATARASGLEVIQDFFSADSYWRAREPRRARAVTSIAMFYDLEAPQKFVQDVAEILAPDGVWVVELSYMPIMLELNSYDTICHEHLEYYALAQLEWMAERAGLRVHRAELNEVNGGSFRVFLRPLSAGAPSSDDRAKLERIRQKEALLQLNTDAPYAAFRTACDAARARLAAILRQLKTEGKRVHVYGASTKGNTILQACGIDGALVEKAADRNPEKWGKQTLGTAIPIVSEQQSRAEQPDYYLVLPWHFLSVFLDRERAYLEAGGRFIVPLPELRVIGGDCPA